MSTIGGGHGVYPHNKGGRGVYPHNILLWHLVSKELALRADPYTNQVVMAVHPSHDCPTSKNSRADKWGVGLCQGGVTAAMHPECGLANLLKAANSAHIQSGAKPACLQSVLTKLTGIVTRQTGCHDFSVRMQWGTLQSMQCSRMMPHILHQRLCTTPAW